MDIPMTTFEHLFLHFAAGFTICAIACGLILAGRLSIRRSADSEKWPAVDGVVLESAVAARRDEGRQRFQPVIRYRYEVGGERYEGSRIRWAAAPEDFRKYTRARKLLDRYRLGSTVKVHYDPRRPGVAVLLPGNATLLRPMHLVVCTAAVYALFTIGLAVAGF
jgi:hypothetical protein